VPFPKQLLWNGTYVKLNFLFERQNIEIEMLIGFDHRKAFALQPWRKFHFTRKLGSSHWKRKEGCN